ncbi:MAG: hypothetical protein A2X80_05160 [Geobacteraceae bacterium GWB2_52_12]|nr:MAG: hypothetical protein A2X80_05160 [Geobacteraceae bacterium GWB2_52_12]
MKKTVLFTIALMAVATMASATIKNSKHDLSSGSTTAFKSAGATNQICIFCHTPHNPTKNVPLWNRVNPAAAGWTMYASPTISATATTKLATGTFDADSISLFCMSCHDGVTAMGAFTNKAGAAADALGAIAEASNANIGDAVAGAGGIHLENDHPVGFNYNTAATEDSGLHSKADANTSLGGSAFFGAAGNNIECSSCHKVHEPGAAGTTAPFLRISNSASALCLACHNK